MFDLLVEILSWHYRRKEKKNRAEGKKVGITFSQYLWIYTFLFTGLIVLTLWLYDRYFKLLF